MGHDLSKSENDKNSKITNKNSITKSFRKRFLKHLRRRHTLSGTFSLRNNELVLKSPELVMNGSMTTSTSTNTKNCHLGYLDINMATEEDFMKLPSINRLLAKAIVEHRNMIGAFNHVEDLALVSGFGADKLHKIRSEVYVNDISDTNLNGKLDLNTATVFDLQRTKNVKQKLAVNIVDYRNRKGGFQSLNQLKKVRGITRRKFQNLKSKLTVLDNETFSGKPISCNNIVPSFSRISANNTLTSSIYYRNRSSKISNSIIEDIFDLMSIYSYRPIIEDAFRNVRNNEKAIRIGTWNLNNLVLNKAENVGFREVFCRTILENNISIIALQEIVDPITLKILCDELNSPILLKIQEWNENSRNWKYCLLDDNKLLTNRDHCWLGFIYETKTFFDRDIEIDLLESFYHIFDSNCDNMGFLCHFKISEIDLYLLNLHLKSEFKDYFDFREVFKNVCMFDKDFCIVAGDFSDSTKKIYDSLCDESFGALSSSTTDNLKHLTNIFLNEKVHSQYTGVSGVIKQGLTHLAIPNGWKWGGRATSNCPVFCELFSDSVMFDCLSSLSLK